MCLPTCAYPLILTLTLTLTLALTLTLTPLTFSASKALGEVQARVHFTLPVSKENPFSDCKTC